MTTAKAPDDLSARIDPGPIALAAFASSTWIMGGLVQFVVGVYSLTAGRLFAAVAFMSYGGFWLSFAVYETFYLSKVAAAEHGHATAWFLAPWLIFTLFLWIASFKVTIQALGASP